MARKGMAIEIEGIKELQSSLRSVDKALPRELRKFNKDAAGIVGEESKRLAPVGPTGRLKNAHTIKAGQRDASLKIGSEVRVPHAGPVIGGYGPRGRPQGGYNIPNPFPFKALANKSKELRGVYDKGVNALAKRLLG